MEVSMARRAERGISYVDGKGYRFTIGKTKGDDGVERYKTWWLGRDDRAFARYAAEDLRRCWDYLKGQGVAYWRPQDSGLVQRIRGVFSQHSSLLVQKIAAAETEAQNAKRQVELYRGGEAAPEPTLAKSRETKPKAMLHDALDAYIRTMKAKPLSPSYRTRIEETVGDLKHFRKNVLLAEVDRVWLENLTDFIKSRPLSRQKSRQTKKREPLAPGTVKTYLQHWRQAFDWLDSAAESDRFGGWMLPRRASELFQVALNQIRTKAERDRAADGPEQLTAPEIKKLIHAGNDRQRMLMLLALFAGMGQTELAVTRRDEFDLDVGLFKHRRNKTSQAGQWWLPAELITLIREYFNDVESSDGLAFKTRENRPLVTEESDSVRQWFDDVRDAAKITRAGVSFYAFRRFLGDRAKRKGGTELRDAALAHAGRNVGDKHYSNFRDYAKVEELGRELYLELKAGQVFEWPTTGHNETKQILAAP
jgi:hypothetical protein